MEQAKAAVGRCTGFLGHKTHAEAWKLKGFIDT
jgi:hypothetical protein